MKITQKVVSYTLEGVTEHDMELIMVALCARNYLASTSELLTKIENALVTMRAGK